MALILAASAVATWLGSGSAGGFGTDIVNLSLLKNGRARALRFSTLARLCEALDCQPRELLACGPAAGPDAAGQ
jgi:Cro/C1-type HTH DNA-binding domain